MCAQFHNAWIRDSRVLNHIRRASGSVGGGTVFVPAVKQHQDQFYMRVHKHVRTYLRTSCSCTVFQTRSSTTVVALGLAVEPARVTHAGVLM